MKLCHIVPSLAPRHGGPSKSVRALANHLALDGNTVELLATSVPQDPPLVAGADAATIHVFPRPWPEWIVRSPGLRHHLEAGDFDCVHHHSLWLRTLGYAANATRRRRAPLVISPRGMMTEWAWNHRRSRKQLAAWFIHPGAFAQAAGWHATSKQEAEDIRRLGFKQPVCVAPNGVSIPESAGLVAARAAWHQLSPATARRPVALFYSRLHQKKRVRELIDLWLAEPRGDWLLLVVGSAEEYTAEQLAAEVAARDASESIAVHEGAGLPPPYAVASLFLLPSHSENFGLVIAEALAAGVPALVTDTTPWEGLPGTGAGWCVAWDAYPATLRQALATAPAELAASGTRGRQWMARDFSWAGAAAVLQQFYRQLKS